MSPPVVNWGSASVTAVAAMLHASWRGVPCSASQKTGSRTSTANGECAPSWASRRSATTGKYAKAGMAAAQRGSHSQGVNSADRPIADGEPAGHREEARVPAAHGGEHGQGEQRGRRERGRRPEDLFTQPSAPHRDPRPLLSVGSAIPF